MRSPSRKHRNFRFPVVFYISAFFKPVLKVEENRMPCCRHRNRLWSPCVRFSLRSLSPFRSGFCRSRTAIFFFDENILKVYFAPKIPPDDKCDYFTIDSATRHLFASTHSAICLLPDLSFLRHQSGQEVLLILMQSAVSFFSANLILQLILSHIFDYLFFRTGVRQWRKIGKPVPALLSSYQTPRFNSTANHFTGFHCWRFWRFNYPSIPKKRRRTNEFQKTGRYLGRRFRKCRK